MIFSEQEVDSIARSTGFVKRNRKLNPVMFLDLMFHSVCKKKCSLEKTVLEASFSHNFSLSRQGLDNRFSASSVLFSKQLLARVLTHLLPIKGSRQDTDLFERVLIKDSTRIEVDDSFVDMFPGYGGALMSIQFEYDLKSGQITDIDIQRGLDRVALCCFVVIHINCIIICFIKNYS